MRNIITILSLVIGLSSVAQNFPGGITVRKDELLWFNADYYGAVANDATDDYSAISNAVWAAHAAGGGVVYVPPIGTYLLSDTINLTNNVHLVTEWGGATLKMMDAAVANKSIIRINTISNVAVQGFVLDGNYVTRGLTPGLNEDNGLWIQYSTNIYINVAAVRNNAKDGLNCDEVRDLVIEGGLWEGNGNNGVGTHGADIRISKAHFLSNSWENSLSAHPGGLADVSTVRLTVSDCIFSSNKVQLLKQGGHDYTIKGNTFYGYDASTTNIIIQSSSIGNISGNAARYGVAVLLGGDPQQLNFVGNTWATHKGYHIQCIAGGGDLVTINGDYISNRDLSAGTGVGARGIDVYVFDDWLSIVNCTFYMSGAHVVLASGVDGVTVDDNKHMSSSTAMVLVQNNSSSHKITNNKNLSPFNDWLNIDAGSTNNQIIGNLSPVEDFLLQSSNNVVQNCTFRELSLAGSARSNSFENLTLYAGLRSTTTDFVPENYWWNVTSTNRHPVALLGVATRPYETAPSTIFFDFTKIFWREEFPGGGHNASGDVGERGWTVALIGSPSGGNFTYIDSVAPHYGIYAMYTGTAASTGYALSLSGSTADPLIGLNAATGWEYQGIFRVTDTNQIRLRIGFADQNTTFPSANFIGVGLDITRDSTGYWIFETRSSSSSTTNASSITVSTTPYYKFRMRSITAGTILFNMAQAGQVFESDVSISTTVPSAGLFPVAQIVTSAGTATQLNMDAFTFQWTGLVR